MEVLADKAISETDKVSYEHINFTPLLAPQTPPEDIIACIDRIYKEEVDKVVKGGEKAEGLTEEFYVRYRATVQENTSTKEGVKVSNEHQDSAPALLP